MLGWLFGKSRRIVRQQVRTGEPPEARVAYDKLCSLHWAKWRTWMVLASAYQAESRASVIQGRVFDQDRYIELLRNAGNYPDGFTTEEALAPIKQGV